MVIISSILSEIPEQGGGSRIFWQSPQGEALCFSLILRMFCSISSLYRVRVRASSILPLESCCSEVASAYHIIGDVVLFIAGNRQVV